MGGTTPIGENRGQAPSTEVITQGKIASHSVKPLQGQELGLEVPVSGEATKSDFFTSVINNESEAEKTVQIAIHLLFGEKERI